MIVALCTKTDAHQSVLLFQIICKLKGIVGDLGG